MMSSVRTLEIIIGLLIGLLLMKSYVHLFGTIYKGPDSSLVKGWVYEWKRKYYNFTPKPVIGPVGAKHV